MISVTILTKNAGRTLKKTLDSVQEFDEILLLDNGSTDDTLLIASTYPNVSIHYSPFIGFGPLHNLASRFAKNDWILALDSDEVLSSVLKESIKNRPLEKTHIYLMDRKNIYNGKWIKGCGWYPDRKVRLFHRKVTSFTEDHVHEKVREEGLKIYPLEGHIEHTPYLTISDFLKKMDHYSTLYVQNYPHKKSSFAKAVLMGLYTFFKSYLLKRGILDGKEGFIISLYNSQTTYYKYLKLALNHNSDCDN